MVLQASEILQDAALVSQLDGISIPILHAVAVIDDVLDGRTLDLHWVALGTFLVLGAIKVTIGKYRGVEWYSLTHSVVTGVGALMAVYLDVTSSQLLTGIAEPLRSCQCQGPLTSLHRMVPAITMGYAVIDLLEGATLGIDFALHGCFTLLVMIFYVSIMKAPQIVTPYIIMEISTINLALVRADFFPKMVSLINQALFAFFFFLFRIVIFPMLYYQLVTIMYRERMTDTFQSCFSPVLFPFTTGMGLCFHALNAFWFYKIVRKMIRKWSGQEGIQANNELCEQQRLQEEASSQHGQIQKKQS